ncbi:hypothetical protein M0812_01710 [Anaeramoeba flamelloides]|uniref:Uncharacterized protein n=1 Tax=Anaeramoeba flamelloides TaxID=1746091 RepID=A0AAV7YXH8_9EUKA|nr:hypothetical protein M0812_01710 [Anaeramoeba flamelloides]|eukprot:Anaeramoba_flamelloidesa325345_43.p1 GENE.a325345_43~~a325345_43.p1  ORF type:complete len:373 (-),score=64.36 a325345_43:321-1439(-)
MVTIQLKQENSMKKFPQTKLSEFLQVYKKKGLSDYNPIEAISEKDEETKVVNLLSSDLVNNFILCVHHCFYSHLPLVLSPDHIWLTIVQGLSIYINSNPDKFRNKFTDKKEKQEISIINPRLFIGEKSSPWEEGFGQISEVLKKKLGEELYNLLVPEYSTTTPTITTTYQITLMDLVKSYYSFKMVFGCGIPSITLEGTLEDWQLIRSKVQKFREFELGWWVDKLDFVLEQFERAFEIGDPNVSFKVKVPKNLQEKDQNKNKTEINFWESFYKWNGASFGNKVTGWVNVFFPFHQNGTINKACQFCNWNSEWRSYGIPLSAFPSGMTKTDFAFVSEKDGVYPMKVLAGFYAAEQGENCSLRPKIGWVLVHDK